ncbi:MAG: helical backbone metal receptor [Dehalococcoidia bacterium]
MQLKDALGRELELASTPARTVSLVPSITEAIYAYGAADRLVGVTQYCIEPPQALRDKAPVGGTKTIDLGAVRALNPDLVIASAEENEKAQVEALIATGLTVYVIDPRTVQAALVMLADVARMLGVMGKAGPLLNMAARAMAQVRREVENKVRVFCPMWRRPYMSVGADTYMHDLIEACGGLNIFRNLEGHYPEVTLAQVAERDPEVILLPDEPYPFAVKHKAEIEAALPSTTAVRNNQVHLVDGKMLCWYGPRISGALWELSGLFAKAAGS